MSSRVVEQLGDARRHLERGEFKEVLALCRPLMSGMPLEPEICSLIGAALLGLGRALQALRVIAPAGDANPERADLGLLRISCLLAGGKFDLAARSAERALLSDPGNPRLHALWEEASALHAELDALIGCARRPLLTQAQRSALQADLPSSYRTVPIIINSRDRRACLEQLVVWLRSAGYTNLAILDNESTYPPLLEYLQSLGDEIIIYRLPRNHGPRALWSSGLISVLGDVPFVYTDPDIVPVEDCPADAVLTLWQLLDRHRLATKAGMGIRIDDIPDSYEHKSAVQSWEGQFWRKPLAGNCYDAPVDTTFALYRPGSWHDLLAVRAGPPYLVRHLPWYADSACPTPEDRYYADHAQVRMSSWGGPGIFGMYRMDAAPL
jgi:hypothetical protein